MEQSETNELEKVVGLAVETNKLCNPANNRQLQEPFGSLYNIKRTHILFHASLYILTFRYV